MSMNTSVFEMVHQVLGDAKEKLAQDKAAARGVVKTAAAKPQPSAKPSGNPADLSNEYLGKLASACDHLASNIHMIDHQRSPQEKLAEAVAINQALLKEAFEVGKDAPPEPTEEVEKGDGNKGPHQKTQANADSIPPNTVSLTTGSSAGAGSNAIPAAPATTPGESMDAGESGEATSGNQPPKNTSAAEKPNPQDASNAFETNKGMLQPDQPEALLQQAGGDSENGSPSIKTARAARTLGKVTGRSHREAGEKLAAAKKVRSLLIKAAQAGIPQDVALAMMGLGKHAEDALNPAQISADTKPILQQEPGVPAPLMQGSEAGSNTPRETAPTTGEGGGRELLSSNESAMNATKGQAKTQGKGALSELLTEPMQSSSTDKTLQQSLDNTSSAGVKISAARELLKKFAASPQGARKLAALAKLALDPEMAAAAEEAAAGEGGGEEEGGVSPEAIAAVEAGVTPEELAEAEALLGEGEAAAAEAAPEAGAEEPEKTEQIGMGMPSGGGLGAQPTGIV